MLIQVFSWSLRSFHSPCPTQMKIMFHYPDPPFLVSFSFSCLFLSTFFVAIFWLLRPRPDLIYSCNVLVWICFLHKSEHLLGHLVSRWEQLYFLKLKILLTPALTRKHNSRIIKTRCSHRCGLKCIWGSTQHLIWYNFRNQTYNWIIFDWIMLWFPNTLPIPLGVPSSPCFPRS